MNWVDLIILAVILMSGLLALMRGLVREVVGLAAWIASALVAYELLPLLQPWARSKLADPALADTLAFLGLFVVALIVLSIVAGAIGSVVAGSSLGGLDRTLGLVFGLVRGAVLVCVAYIVIGLALSVDQWPDPVRNARALPLVHRGAVWIAELAPDGYRPSVAPLPAGRPTTAADLMQASPTGRPMGSRPARE